MALYNEKVSYFKQIARQHSWLTVKILLTSSLITMQNVAVVCMRACKRSQKFGEAGALASLGGERN